MSNTPTTSKHPYGPPDRWFILLLVALNYFTLILHRQVIAYILPPLQGELGLTETQIGWLLPAFTLPYALPQIFLGYLGDRFRRRTILLCSLVCSVVVVCAMALVRNYEELLVLRACLGLAQAASVPAIGGIMADVFTAKNRSTAVSIYLMSFMGGIMIAGNVGGNLAEIPAWTFPLGGAEFSLSGWRIAMLAFGLFGAVMVVILGLLLREPERSERSTDKGLGTAGGNLWATVYSVLRVPSYLVLAAIFTLFCVIQNLRDMWLAKYFHDTFGMTTGEAGRFSTIWIQPAMFGGLLLGGVWADYWSRRWQGGRAGSCAIAMVVWVPALWFMGTSVDKPVIAAAMLFFGFAFGIYIANIWTTTFEIIDPAARSTSLGMLNAFGAVASLGSPVLGGLMDRGIIDNYGTAFAALSCVALLIVVLFVFHILVTLPRDFRGSGTGEDQAPR